MLTIPNMLTFFRIFSIPIIIWLDLNGNFQTAFWLAVVGSLSDFFDGKIARALNQTSEFGSLLDPIADKLFEFTFTLYFYYVWDLPLYFVILIWLRNWLQLSAIPVLLWWKKVHFYAKPKWPSKWASALGMIVICSVLGARYFVSAKWIKEVTSLLIPISAALEVYVLATFLPRYYQIYQGRHDTFE